MWHRNNNDFNTAFHPSVKVKNQGLQEKRRYSSAHSYLPTLYGGEWSMSHPDCSTPKKKSWYALTRRPGGPQSWSENFGEKKNLCPYQDSNPRMSKPMPSHYTDWDTLEFDHFTVKMSSHRHKLTKVHKHHASSAQPHSETRLRNLKPRRAGEPQSCHYILTAAGNGKLSLLDKLFSEVMYVTCQSYLN
jgi:hypothetical protein